MARGASATFARVLVMIIVAFIAIDSVLAELPRKSSPANADEAVFSGDRALAFAHELLPEEKPHPTGSDENMRVRERIVTAFTRLGYEPEVTATMSCSPYGSCATVHNVVAKLAGKREDAVLVAAHYDSVPAGPGVGDDLAGAASVLEIARAMKRDAGGESTVVFLVDDGEELGLLGAHAFIKDVALTKTIRYAVNMDNRGTRGPAMMFETSADNAQIAALMGQALPHPVSSSLFYEVYKRMPNDTDFTVWKSAGIRGTNFAFIGGATSYHTPNDDFAHLDTRSLQHEGENGLAMARAFRAEDPKALSNGDATYFDLFGAVLARYPAQMGVPLAIVALFLSLIGAITRGRRRVLSLGGVFIANAAWLLALGLALAFGFGLARALGLGVSLSPWPRTPAPALAAFGLAGTAAAALVLAGVHARAKGALAYSPWIAFHLVGIAVSWFLPGGSYLYVVPGIVAGVTAIIASRVDRAYFGLARDVLGALPIAALAIVWTPVFVGVYWALGLALPFVFSIIAMLFAWPVLALVRSRKTLISYAAFSIGLAALSTAVFVARPSEVGKTSLWHVEDAKTHTAAVFANPISGPPRGAFSRVFDDERTPLPWLGKWRAHAASPTGAPSPSWDVMDNFIENGDRTVSGIVRSPRGATEVRLAFAPDREVKRVRVDDRDVPPLVQRALTRNGGWRVYRIDALPPDGVTVAATLRGVEEVHASLCDVTFGLPADVVHLAEERDASAIRMQDGDVTVIWTAVP